MRNSLTGVLAVALFCVIHGCAAASFHSLWTDQNVVFDEKLVGVYDDGQHVVEKGPGKSYIFTSKDEKGNVTSTATVHLVKLGDLLFSDMEVPAGEDVTREPAAKVLHAIDRIEIDGGTVRAFCFPDSKYLEFADAKTVTVTTTSKDGAVATDKLLSLSTKEMEAFVVGHAKEMSKKTMEMKRVAK